MTVSMTTAGHSTSQNESATLVHMASREASDGPLRRQRNLAILTRSSSVYLIFNASAPLRLLRHAGFM